MQPRIETLSQKKFIGQHITMSFSNNKTAELWRGFMPRRKEVEKNIDKNLYSIEVYNPLYFDSFDPGKEFEKWAAVEVADFNKVPNGMETIISPEGLYAIFIHKGPASEGPATYNYIFKIWLPNSIYILDNRPHFAVMGDKYKHEDPNSEEELWIPIRYKDGAGNNNGKN